MSARFATDDPASMLPSLPDTAEVGSGQRQPRDVDCRRCSCVDNGAPDDGSDDVHGNNHRRTTAQGGWLDDVVDVSVPGELLPFNCQQRGAEHRRISCKQIVDVSVLRNGLAQRTVFQDAAQDYGRRDASP